MMKAHTCIALLLAWPGLIASNLQAAEQPNIIVFMADDLGWNDVGYHGSEINTPNIDRLASEAVRLEQFYVMPWCSATRAAFETGMNSARFGMRSLEHNFPNRTALPPDLPTLPELLRKDGYATALVGKWHLSYGFEGGPLERGYDRAFGFLHGQMDHYTHDNQHGISTLFRDSALIDAEGHMTDLIAGELSGLLQQTKTPFFVNVTFSAPHYPLQAPEQFLMANPEIEHPDRKILAAMVTHMDSAIGEILGLLKKEGLLERTIIVFLSDNGGDNHWGEGKEDWYGGAHGPYTLMSDNSPLRGAKTEVYEGGIRVPAFIYYQRELKPAVVDAFTSVVDLLPTLLDFAGAEPPTGRDGESLLPLLSGSSIARMTEYYWFTNNVNIPGGGGKQDAIRDGRWKLIESQRRFFWLPWRFEWPWPRVELFDMEQDPEETTNLADAKPELVARLRARLRDYRENTFGSYPGASSH